MTVQRAIRFVVSLLPALVLARPAFANGDLFFEAMEIPGDPEYVFFGNVKDERGKYIEGATITVSIEEPRLIYTAHTDLLGRYRTLDVGRAITGLGYEVNPSVIDITVEYPGYRMERRWYRGKYRQKKGAIEVNFIMRKEESSAKP